MVEVDTEVEVQKAGVDTVLMVMEERAEMTIIVIEEETGWGGSVNFNNGIATEEESYENKCRDCDEINTLEYCEEGCGEICDSCHYMGEADLECVAECDTHKVFLDDQHVPEYRKV